jgi:hypothetical protein
LKCPGADETKIAEYNILPNTTRYLISSALLSLDL